jgi:hypothetical protein
MNTNNSKTTTLARLNSQQIGTHSLGNGSETQSALSGHDYKEKVVKQIPRLFKRDVTESMMLRVYEIRFQSHLLNYSNSSDTDNEIKKVIPKLQSKLTLATSKDVAVVIETISSTFSIPAPNELGLVQYFKILETYPLVFLNECMDKLIREFRYPRLPLPVEFVDRIDVENNYHNKWLDRLCNDMNKVDNK